MKKLVVLLLALAVIGLAVYADDAMAAPAPQGQFHAWNYGMMMTYASVDGGPASVGWGPSWDPNYGIDQEWTFSYDGKNYGYSGTFEFGMGNFGQSTTGGNGEISWFNTYYKFGDVAKVTLGKLDIGDYRWTTFIEGAANARFGQRDYAGMLQVYPISGLSLAVLQRVPGDTTAWGPGPSEDATNYSYGTNADADYQQNLNLAASYEMKDTFKAYVAWNNSANEVSVGVNLMATKPLTVQVVYDDDYTAPVKTSTVWLTAGYTMGALALTLDAGYANGINQYQAGGSLSDTLSAMAGEVQIEYTFGQYAVGAKIGYDDGKGMGLFNGQAAGWTGFEAWPYIKANFDNGSNISIGILYASGANNGGEVLNSASWNAGTPGYSKSLFAVPIAYTWAF